MARTPSTMIPLGTKAPGFELLDTVSGNMLSLDKMASKKATVVMFICNHCPFVRHLNQGIAAVARDFTEKGVSFIAISSNDVDNYPDDSPEKMKIVAEDQGFVFPYLYDETQEVARAYNAVCTPDFFVFDAELACVYRGQFDDSRPDNGLPVTGKDLRDALDAILAGKPVPEEQQPSLGCNIKWKAA